MQAILVQAHGVIHYVFVMVLIAFCTGVNAQLVEMESVLT
jgi:hypothetical protein